MTKEEILLKIGERIAELSHNASQICEEYEGYRLACMDISDILDEITKELSKPSLPSDIDEAALKELQAYLPQGNGPDGICYFIAPQMLAMYKAGAEWMSLQRTRTRLAVKSNTPEGKEAYEKVAKEMRASVAAKDYGEGIYCPILKHKNKTGLNCTAVEDAFLKGAEWMAGRDKEKIEQAFFSGYNECEDRMKKEFERRAMAGEVNNTGYPTTIQLHTFDSSLKNGDKVNIIIIKQEQD